MTIDHVFPVPFNGMNIKQDCHTHLLINHLWYVTMTCFIRQLQISRILS